MGIATEETLITDTERNRTGETFPVSPQLDQKLSTKRRPPRLWLILLGILLTGAVAGLVFWSNPKVKPNPAIEEPDQYQVLVEEEEPVSLQDTVLRFDPISPVATGSAVALPLRITTGANMVTVAQINLRFAPGTLRGIRIIPGSFFARSNVLKTDIDEVAGVAGYALGGFAPRQGEGILLTLQAVVYPQDGQEIVVAFGPTTEVAAKDEPGNVLRLAQEARILLKQL